MPPRDPVLDREGKPIIVTFANAGVSVPWTDNTPGCRSRRGGWCRFNTCGRWYDGCGKSRAMGSGGAAAMGSDAFGFSVVNVAVSGGS
jgi:hypothetical protein